MGLLSILKKVSAQRLFTFNIDDSHEYVNNHNALFKPIIEQSP